MRCSVHRTGGPGRVRRQRPVRTPGTLRSRMDDDALFEDWVIEAIEALPAIFRDQLGSVAITIEAWPSQAQLEATGAPGLFGLYQGVPRSAIGADHAAIPSRITIFRGPDRAVVPGRRGASGQGVRHGPPRDRPPLRDLGRAAARARGGPRRGRAAALSAAILRLVDAHILLVEDDPSIREVTALGLTCRRLHRHDRRGRRRRPRALAERATGPRPARRHAAQARRVRGLPGDPARVHDADRDAHGARRHDRRRRRPRVGRRRLRTQAVRDARARRPGARRATPPDRRLGPDDANGSEPAISLGDLRIDLAGRTVDRDGRDIPLTRTEFDLLVELARRPGQVFTRDQLLDRVWGYDYLGDSRLVDVAVGRLRSKVEPDPAAPVLVLTVRGAGYKAARPAG